MQSLCFFNNKDIKNKNCIFEYMLRKKKGTECLYFSAFLFHSDDSTTDTESDALLTDEEETRGKKIINGVRTTKDGECVVFSDCIYHKCCSE